MVRKNQFCYDSGSSLCNQPNHMKEYSRVDSKFYALLSLALHAGGLLVITLVSIW